MWQVGRHNYCWTSTFLLHLAVSTGCRAGPNKSYLSTRHFAALHTFLQCIKDGADGLPGQTLLSRRHGADNSPVRCLNCGGTRDRTEQTPTGKNQQRGKKHLNISFVNVFYVLKMDYFKGKTEERSRQRLTHSLRVFLQAHWTAELSSQLKPTAISLDLNSGSWLAETWLVMSYTCLSSPVSPVQSREGLKIDLFSLNLQTSANLKPLISTSSMLKVFLKATLKPDHIICIWTHLLKRGCIFGLLSYESKRSNLTVSTVVLTPYPSPGYCYDPVNRTMNKNILVFRGI